MVTPLLILSLAACATLPDTGGYTSATVEVRQSAAAVGDAVEAEIVAAAAGIEEEGPRRAVEASAGDFRRAWNLTLGSLDATVRYAQSIQDVVDAGNRGAESARKVAASVSGLAGALGVTMGPAGAAVADTGAFVYGQIARIRAARSLAAALAAAGPAILRLQELVAGQVGDARTAFLRASAAELRALDRPAAFGTYVHRDADLSAEEKARLSDLADFVLLHPEQADRIAALKDRLKVIGDTRAALAPGLGQYRLAAAEVARRRRAGLAVFDATDTALAAWAAAHQRLVSAVRNHQAVTVASVTTAAADLRALVRTWREL